MLHDFGNILPLQIDSNIAGYAQYFLENFTSKTIDDLKLIGSSWNKVIKFYDETDINKILAEMAIKDAVKAKRKSISLFDVAESDYYIEIKEENYIYTTKKIDVKELVQRKNYIHIIIKEIA